MDERLRRLERDATQDPHSRFRLHALQDRLAWPDGPPLSEEVDAEVEQVGPRIAEILEPMNGDRSRFRVELEDVASALVRLFELPPDGDVISHTISGIELAGPSSPRPTHAVFTIVMITGGERHVVIFAAMGALRAGEERFGFPPRGARGVPEERSFVLIPREVIERWARRAAAPPDA